VFFAFPCAQTLNLLLQKSPRVAISLGAMFFALWFPCSVRAQLTGSVSIGAQATNNVQTLDTIAPDQILMPAFQLNYDVHLSGVSTISLTGSYSPSFYNFNPGLSFQETSIGATGLFYLSHQDAITAEALENGSEDEPKHTRSSHLLTMERNEMELLRSDQSQNPIPMQIASSAIHTSSNKQSKNDSLVDLAVSALYTLSAELDSTDISPAGISKARISELEDLRDSISDVISTIADLLDSAGYSESTSEVVVTELEHIRAPLLALLPHTKPSHTDTTLLDVAIHFLQQAKPEIDFLPTAPTPMAPSGASVETKQLVHSLASIKNVIPGASAETTSAPNITLLTSSTRLRTFGYNDATIHEDADDSDATTMAAALTVPVAYTHHAGVHYSPADSLLFGSNYGGNPNDNKMLTFGAAVEGLTSTNFSLRGAYDYTVTSFSFDSVYSNTENRVTLSPRLALGKSIVLMGEGAVGFKKYIDPLHLIDTVKGLLGRTLKVVNQTAASTFDQFSFGAGLTQFVGEQWVVGALTAFNDNPSLRAYVTSAQLGTGVKGKAVRAAAQIADDEYTYNLGRYTLFTNARIFSDLDFGLDFSYEHRTYGSAVGPKGAVLDSGRTENGEFLDASLSKLIPFDEQLIGVFNGLLLEAKIELADVVSTEPIYGYTLAEVTFTTTLTF
jgi:hypothetical protein